MLSAYLKRIKNSWSKLGPGIVTGASDDDPSGIATYTQAGAMFGLKILWIALITFPLQTAIQEMCGRIGLVTSQGLAKVIKNHYPKYILYLVAVVTIPACIFNISADLAAMGAVSNMIIPSIPKEIFMIISASIIIFCMIFLSYKKIESVLKWLSIVLVFYIVVPFLVKQDVGAIITSIFIPHFELNAQYIYMLVALLGTTISPYLFIWEVSMEGEHHIEKYHLNLRRIKNKVNKGEIKDMRRDNFLGMFSSNLAMFFIILAASSVLFNGGSTGINTVEQAASSLRPLAGDSAYFLFAVGIIGMGFLAIPVLAGACSYLLSETFGWQEGMDKHFKDAKGFYLIIIVSILIGIIMNLFGVNIIKMLIYSAVFYGIIAPVLIAVILLISNNKKIMGEYVNGRWSNILGITCLVLMSLSVIALLVISL